MDNITVLGSGPTKYVYNHPSKETLEYFDSPSKHPYNIHIICPEFTSLCPKTGQPDFATIIIDYVPNNFCIESKSLKLYLFSFRQFGEFHEACINRMADDIHEVIKPIYIKVVGQFMPRGGISIWPTVERGNNVYNF